MGHLEVNKEKVDLLIVVEVTSTLAALDSPLTSMISTRDQMLATLKLRVIDIDIANQTMMIMMISAVMTIIVMIIAMNLRRKSTIQRKLSLSPSRLLSQSIYQYQRQSQKVLKSNKKKNKEVSQPSQNPAKDLINTATDTITDIIATKRKTK